MTAAVQHAAVLRAALEVLCAERQLGDESPSVTKLQRAEDRLALAARDLTNAIDDMPPVQRPKGWATQ